jgi:hypothetical protein
MTILNWPCHNLFNTLYLPSLEAFEKEEEAKLFLSKGIELVLLDIGFRTSIKVN